MKKSRERHDKEMFKRIFDEHWESFKMLHVSYQDDYYDEVIKKMLNCGKEAGGYSEYVCSECGGDIRRVCFSCKSTFCLSCAKGYTDNVVSQVSEKLHAGIIYRHVVLTIPEQLRRVFYRDRKKGKLLSELMRTAQVCLESVAKTVRRREMKIGTIIVVQTHGRSGRYNPHVHIIMTDGGIDQTNGMWVKLGYIPYEIIHKQWQYNLLKMLKKEVGEEIEGLLNKLWSLYPKGFVANVKKGQVPESCRGLARYLAKYVASPPIAVRRIISYDGKQVTYWYNDHKSHSKKIETVDVLTFIGRMVQHIMPKGFKRIRYYGLQSTKSFQKWKKIIEKGIQKIGIIVKGTYQIVVPKRYRERYKEVTGKDPLKCKNCGKELKLLRIWHPDYGVLYENKELLQ